MADASIPKSKAEAQVQSRRRIEEPAQPILGYVLSEEAELKLRTIADAMRGIATLTEGDSGNVMPEGLSSGELAAIFRVIGEATENICNSAAFAVGEGLITQRSLN